MPAVHPELAGDFESILKTVSEINCEEDEDLGCDKRMSCENSKERVSSCSVTKSSATKSCAAKSDKKSCESSEFFAVAIKFIAKFLGILFNMSLMLFESVREYIGTHVLYLYGEFLEPSCPAPKGSSNIMARVWFGLQLAFFALIYGFVFVIVAILKLMLFEIPL